MINKDKLVLVAMVSMLLPGASTGALAENNSESDRKASKKSMITQKQPAVTRSSDTLLKNGQKSKLSKRTKQAIH